jgi:hypothetical protein
MSNLTLGFFLAEMTFLFFCCFISYFICYACITT